jgi:hypothetical protein
MKKWRILEPRRKFRRRSGHWRGDCRAASNNRRGGWSAAFWNGWANGSVWRWRALRPLCRLGRVRRDGVRSFWL